VYAVETKWTARSDLERFLRGSCWQAGRQAKELAAVLAADDVRREVVPVLVVWGPGIATALGEPRLVGQVRVVAGAHATDWLERMNTAADRFEVDWPAVRALESHVRSQESLAAVR
jgi:hypothetical protein